MIGTTFKTLKNHPEIIVGMIIASLAGILFYLPSFIGMGDMMSNMMNNIEMLESSDPAAMQEAFGVYNRMAGLGTLGSFVVAFLFIPPVLYRVYEACAGTAEPGWIKRGIKECWWKPFVMSVIIGVAATVVMLVTMLLMLIPVLGVLIMFAVTIAIMVFSVIAITAVIAEQDFSKVFGGIFIHGWKYFFKLLGVLALYMIIPLIVMSAFMGVMIASIAGLSDSTLSDPVMMAGNIMAMMKPMIIMYIILGIYSFFAVPFVYTYSMHQYLSVKGDTPPVYGGTPQGEYVITSRDMTL